MATYKTVTVKSSGGTYTNLNAVDAGEATDLTAESGDLVVLCDNIEDTTAVIFDGAWTTDATHRVIIRAVDDHDGTWDTSAYRLTNSSTSPLINKTVDYLFLDGIQINATHTTATLGGYYAHGDLNAVGVTEMDRCVLVGPDAGAANIGVWNSEPLHDIEIRNSVVYGWYRGLGSTGSGAKIVSENVTVDDCDYGVRVNYGGHVLTNTRITNCTTPIATGEGNIDAASDYNLTDGTAPTNWGANSIDSTDTPTVDYVDDDNATLTSRDYHISTDDDGYGAGDDLSGSFTDDIDGDERGVWSIGADDGPGDDIDGDVTVGVAIASAMIYTSQDVSYHIPLTVASGTVSADLTDFPVQVDLSDMPAVFWDRVTSDGGDIRIRTTAGAEVEIDLPLFDYENQEGVLFFKAGSVPSGSAATWNIHYGDSSLSAPGVSGTYGRDAVWEDYEFVVALGDGEEAVKDRTGKAPDAVAGAGPHGFATIPLGETTREADVTGGHQGVVFDGTHFYIADTNKLYKYDTDWTEIDSVSDITTDISGSVADHSSGLAYDPATGYLYFTHKLESNPATEYYLVVYDTADLSFVAKYDISSLYPATIPNLSGCGLDPVSGNLYHCSNADQDRLFIMSKTGSYVGYLDLSEDIPNPQGLDFWKGYIWIGGYTIDAVWQVDPSDGTVIGPAFSPSDESGSVYGEDVCGYGDELYFLYYQGGVLGDVLTLNIEDIVTLYGGRGIKCSASDGGGITVDFGADGSRTAWTLGGSCLAQNNPSMWYLTETVSNAADRVGVVYWADLRGYDTSNGYLYAVPDLDCSTAPRRVHLVYNGTSYREIFGDGSPSGTDNTITGRGTSQRYCLVGGGSQNMKGYVGWLYLRDEVLSDEWIEAEYLNGSAPDTFITPGSEASAPYASIVGGVTVGMAIAASAMTYEEGPPLPPTDLVLPVPQTGTNSLVLSSWVDPNSPDLDLQFWIRESETDEWFLKSTWPAGSTGPYTYYDLQPDTAYDLGISCKEGDEVSEIVWSGSERTAAAESITGAVTVGVAVASTMMYATIYTLAAQVTVVVTPNATEDYQQNKTIEGQITIWTSVSSGMVRNRNPVLAGAVLVGVVPTAAFASSESDAIGGNVVVGITPAADLGYTPLYTLTGDITVAPAINGAFDYTFVRDIDGAIMVSVAPASDMAAVRQYTFTGAVPVSVVPDSLLLFLRDYALVVDPPLTVYVVPAAVLAYTPEQAIVGAVTVGVAVAGVLSYRSPPITGGGLLERMNLKFGCGRGGT